MPLLILHTSFLNTDLITEIGGKWVHDIHHLLQKIVGVLFFIQNNFASTAFNTKNIKFSRSILNGDNISIYVPSATIENLDIESLENDLKPEIDESQIVYIGPDDIPEIVSHQEVIQSKVELTEQLKGNRLCLGLKRNGKICAYTWCDLDYCSYKGWKILPVICYDLRFPVWSRNRIDEDTQLPEYDLLIYVAMVFLLSTFHYVNSKNVVSVLYQI